MSGQGSFPSNKRGNEMVPLEVEAHWDADASVWWAESGDLPGLATEAPSFPELVDHVKSLAPLIISENLGRVPNGITVHVSGSESEETFRI
jgi:Domain of unknown function (DUF1902)